MMRVVFMGTPAFAVPSLFALSAAHDVVAVYTRPDAVSGRGKGVRPSPVKDAAHELGIPVLQPRTLRDPGIQSELSDLAPDVIVVAAFGMILPRAVLDIPRYGCVNVHASLLPRWRGAAPIQRAILAGDCVAGVSIMRMEEGLDTGPYCVTAQTEVDDHTTDTLTVALADLGAQALMAALERIEAGTVVWMEQDEACVTYAEKISKSDVTLSPELSATDAVRRVRASSRQAPARLSIEGRPATVLAVEPSTERLDPGAVACTKRDLLLGFADASLRVTSIKPDGKQAMEGCAWVRGLRIDGGGWSAV